MIPFFQRCTLLAFVITGLQLWSGMTLAAQDEPVLVWRLKALGVEPELAQKVEELLSKEIDHLHGIRLLGHDELTPVLMRKPELAQCGGQIECLVEIGSGAGASRVISGVLGKLGDTFSLDIKVVDVKAGKEADRLAQTWDGGDETLIEVVRQVATRALRPSAFRGQVLLFINVPKVKIYIDGDYLGRSPLKKPLSLVPGRHALKLVRKNYKDVERFVDVTFARTTKVYLTLKEAAISEVISSQKAHRWWAAGLRASIVADGDGFWAPELSLDLGLRFPWLSERFSLVLQSEIYGKKFDGPAKVGPKIDLPVEGGLLVCLATLGLRVHLWPNWPLTPYMDAGLGMAIVWGSMQAEGFEAQQSRQVRFTFHVGTGLAIRLGPGELFSELRYQNLAVDQTDTGGFVGSLGAIHAGLGYRLVF